MKKAFLIFFVLVAAIGACFAASGDKLILTTSIAVEPPEFQIIGTYNGVAGTGTHIFENVVSPADNDITLDIAIKQSQDSRCKNKYTLSVSATPFTKDGDETQKTSAPVVVSDSSSESGSPVPKYTLLTGATNISVSNFKSEASGDDTKVSVDLEYDGPKVEHVSLDNIAEWQFKWTHKTSLVAGNYTATVTLSYTAL